MTRQINANGQRQPVTYAAGVHGSTPPPPRVWAEDRAPWLVRSGILRRWFR